MTERSLIKVAPDALGTLMPFLPDTPWTTPTLHVVHERHGDAFVDSPESPRNLVVVARGNGRAEHPDQAFLFGVPTAHGLREFVSETDRATEFVCDEDLAQLVREFHPGVKKHEHVVCWYDYMGVDVPVPEHVAARRLRMADGRLLEALLPPWAFRTYTTSKSLIMGGAAYGVFAGDDLVSAAFLVDHSTKFERVAAFTAESHRRLGFAHAALAKLVNGAADRSRIPCCIVRRDNVAAWGLVIKLGFNKRAVLTTYSTVG
jgi:hypothetical protein